MSTKGKVRIDTNDIVGKSFNKLKVISYEGHYYDTTRNKKMRHLYKVECKMCGKTKLVQRNNIKVTYSCGCLREREKEKKGDKNGN